MNINPSTTFSLGQKVVCINDAFPGVIVDWCDSLPIAGHIYTIRAMQVGRNHISGFSNLGFLLAEIGNPPSSRGGEAGFLRERFVPWLESRLEAKYNDEVKLAQLQIAHQNYSYHN